MDIAGFTEALNSIHVAPHDEPITIHATIGYRPYTRDEQRARAGRGPRGKRDRHPDVPHELPVEVSAKPVGDVGECPVQSVPDLYVVTVRMADGRSVRLFMSGVPANMVTGTSIGPPIPLPTDSVHRSTNSAVIPSSIAAHGGPISARTMMFSRRDLGAGGSVITGNGGVSYAASLAAVLRDVDYLSEAGHAVQPGRFTISNTTIAGRTVDNSNLHLSLAQIAEDHPDVVVYVPTRIRMARMRVFTKGTEDVLNGVCSNILEKGKIVLIGVPHEHIVNIVCEIFEFIIHACVKCNGFDFLVEVANGRHRLDRDDDDDEPLDRRRADDDDEPPASKRRRLDDAIYCDAADLLAAHLEADDEMAL